MPISSWSTTAADNDDADSASGIALAEGQAPGSVNDSIRAIMAEIKKFYDAPSFTARVNSTTGVAARTGGTIDWLESTNNNTWSSQNLANNLVWSYNGAAFARLQTGVGFAVLSGGAFRLYEATNNNYWDLGNTSNNLILSYLGTGKVRFPSSSGIEPTVDNASPLGSASFRWSQLFAGTTTISTSDATEKSALVEPSQEVFDAVLAVPMGGFKWLSAIEEKGEAGARIHYGPTAQGVRDAFLAKGLDPAKFALFCSDAVVDENGEPTGTVRLGLRLDHFDRLRTEAIRRKLVAANLI